MVTLKKLDLAVLDLPAGKQIDDKLIALLASQGLAPDEIARRLDMEEFTVTVILGKPEVTRLIFKLQSALSYTSEQQLEAALSFAVQKLIWLMKHSADEKMQKACSAEVIDRVLGKPVQTVNNRNLNYNSSDVQAIDSNYVALQKRLEKLEGQRQLLLSGSQPIEV